MSALLDPALPSPERDHLLARLRCPRCGHGMLVPPIRPEPGLGAFCLDCDARWPVVRGVLDLLPGGPTTPRQRTYPSGGRDLDFHGFWKAVLAMPTYAATTWDDELFELLSWLDPHPRSGLVILGAGRGEVVDAVAGAVHDGLVLACDDQIEDLCAARLLVARTVGAPTLLVRCDVLDPPLRREAWDAALEYGVLHGAPDPAAHLRLLAKGLRPRGRVAGLSLARSGLPQVAQSQDRMSATSGHRFVAMEALALSLVRAGWREFRHEQPSNWMARYRAATAG